MMKDKKFIEESVIDTSAEKSFEWHERPGALQRLTPPWQNMRVTSQTSGINIGTKVRMINYFFGVPVTLEAKHIAYEKGIFFQDTLIKSPFSSWVHSHSFFDSENGTSILEDKINYRLPFYFPWFMKGLINKELKRIFRYRHDIFITDIKRHNLSKKPLTILLSGASGLLGSALIPFFSTGGHRVLTLVRRQPLPDKNEIFWNPSEQSLDLSGIEHIDVVINLNGAPLAEGRWTEKRKQNIIQSRTSSTALLAETIAKRDQKPDFFFTASAIGYYGDCGPKEITEKSDAGNLFISDVCSQWENAAEKAANAGIRTVFGRIGVVLTASGGALAQMLPAFKAGTGAQISNGSQQMSWISLEDTIGAIWHLILNNKIEGPVNIVAPTPVTNKTFTETLGRVLLRPTWFRIPSILVKLIWGQMGLEILLAGTKVKPEKLLNTGFEFAHQTLEEALRSIMGRLRS